MFLSCLSCDFLKIDLLCFRFFLQESVPLRVKNIHIVNQPYIFNMVFQLFKPFLKDKLKNRIIFHGSDRNSLHQYVSPKCLPPCYGGTLQMPLVSGSQWYELLVLCDKEYEGELKILLVFSSSLPPLSPPFSLSLVVVFINFLCRFFSFFPFCVLHFPFI